MFSFLMINSLDKVILCSTPYTNQRIPIPLFEYL